MTIKSDLVPMATISHELYGRDINGFDSLGGEDVAFTTLSSYGATIGNDDCSGTAAFDDKTQEKYEGFPFIVELTMQTEEQLHTRDKN